MNYGQYPSKSALQENIKAVSPDTWEHINIALVRYALKNKKESGIMTRTDATAVDTNIHEPADSTLLKDGIRVITRTLHKAKELCPELEFTDHTRSAKKRVVSIISSIERKCIKAYKKLLGLARKVVQYGARAVSLLKACKAHDIQKMILA